MTALWHSWSVGQQFAFSMILLVPLGTWVAFRVLEWVARAGLHLDLLLWEAEMDEAEL